MTTWNQTDGMIRAIDDNRCSALPLNRSVRTLPDALLLWFAAIVVCVCSAQEAFCAERPYVPPKLPLPAADSPLPWEGSLFADSAKRRSLADSGFTIWGWNQFHVPAVVSGGIDTDIEPLNRTYAAANFDLEKMDWWEGGQFRVSSFAYAGDNVGDHVGSPYNPSTLYQEPDVKLFQLYYGQWFADKQAHVKIGRIGANSDGDFAANSISNIFDSVGYNGAPGNMYMNNRAFGTSGIAQWGTRLRVEPQNRDYTVAFGVYNTSETFAELSDPDEHGMNFGFDPGEAIMVAGELVYNLNKDPGDTGLPGRYRVGVLYDTGELDRLDAPGRTKSGNFGLYLLADQMIYRERGDTKQGLWSFLQFSMNPDQAINPFPYFASWGLVYVGLFPDRDKDVTAFGNYYNVISENVSGDLEVQFNLLHLFNVTSSLQIGPEIQYIHRPGGTGDIDDALILNLQTFVSF
jgi:porin